MVDVDHVGEHDHEFVAAGPRHQVVVAHRCLEALGDRDEELVADRVADRVVHELEAVDVEEHQHHEGALAAPRCQGARDALPRRQAVRKAGQVVAGRAVRQDRLGSGVLTEGTEHPPDRDAGEAGDDHREHDAVGGGLVGLREGDDGGDGERDGDECQTTAARCGLTGAHRHRQLAHRRVEHCHAQRNVRNGVRQVDQRERAS